MNEDPVGGGAPGARSPDESPDSSPGKSTIAQIGSTRAYALALVWFGWTFAGMDYTIYAYALPLILTELHISIPTAGIVFFLSLQGTFLGSLLVPILADYFGRRPVMMGNILLYALATGVVALAQAAWFLTLIRFLVTFGVGAEQPVGATYISEQWNPKTRARAMGFMQSGFAIGTLIATLLIAVLAARVGWRLLFVIGVIPALLVVGFRIWLPESSRWREEKGKRQAVAPVAPTTPGGSAAPSPATTAAIAGRRGFPMGELFTPNIWKLTLIGTILLVMGNAAGGGITAWAPTFLKLSRGLDISSVGWLGVVNAFGLLAGYNAAGWVADAWSRRWSLILFFALGVVSLIVFGLVTNLVLIGVAYFVVGLAQGGQFGNFIVYLSELFPTSARATGVGWCMGVGLFFWALVPFVLGVLAPSGNFGTLFAVVGGVACIIGVITSYLGPETKDVELGTVGTGPAPPAAPAPA